MFLCEYLPPLSFDALRGLTCLATATLCTGKSLKAAVNQPRISEERSGLLLQMLL